MRRSSAGASSPVTPRLACVRPVASVHPEPGSNSPLYKKFCFFLCPRPPSSYYGLTVAFLVFLPFPAVCHKFPQRTLSSAVRPALRRKRRFPFAVAKVRAFFFPPNFFESFFQVFLMFVKQGLIFRGLRGKFFSRNPPRRPRHKS